MRRPTPDEQASVLEQLGEVRDGDALRVGRHKVRVTSLERALWPGDPTRVTKRDLLAYLVRISPVLLAHAAGRIATVTRSPGGLDGAPFFQRTWDAPPAFVRQVPVWSQEHEAPRARLLLDNLATLLWLAQQDTMEWHVGQARVAAGDDVRGVPTDYASSRAALASSRLNYPDWLLVDLDAYDYSGHEPPGAEPELHRAGFDRVRDIAFEVRTVAVALGLTAFVKTSGKTGLHVLLPIRRHFRFEEVRGMAQVIADFLKRLRPDDVTVSWAVRERRGVFVDANQNARGKTLALAYSPRRHPAATVSMPVSWEALATLYPTDFTIRTVPGIVATHGDAWAGILDAKGDLREALLAAS